MVRTRKVKRDRSPVVPVGSQQDAPEVGIPDRHLKASRGASTSIASPSQPTPSSPHDNRVESEAKRGDGGRIETPRVRVRATRSHTTGRSVHAADPGSAATLVYDRGSPSAPRARSLGGTSLSGATPTAAEDISRTVATTQNPRGTTRLRPTATSGLPVQQGGHIHVCSKCLQPGHNRRTCRSGEAGAVGEGAGDGGGDGAVTGSDSGSAAVASKNTASAGKGKGKGRRAQRRLLVDSDTTDSDTSDSDYSLEARNAGTGRSNAEPLRARRCRVCGDTTHDARKCPEAKRTPRKVGVCSKCLQPGHNRRTCRGGEADPCAGASARAGVHSDGSDRGSDSGDDGITYQWRFKSRPTSVWHDGYVHCPPLFAADVSAIISEYDADSPSLGWRVGKDAQAIRPPRAFTSPVRGTLVKTWTELEPRQRTPVGFFDSVFGGTLTQLLQRTNDSMARANGHRAVPAYRRELSMKELRAYLGVRVCWALPAGLSARLTVLSVQILMSIDNKDRLGDYWQRGFDGDNATIQQAMSRGRWQWVRAGAPLLKPRLALTCVWWAASRSRDT